MSTCWKSATNVTSGDMVTGEGTMIGQGQGERVSALGDIAWTHKAWIEDPCEHGRLVHFACTRPSLGLGSNEQAGVVPDVYLAEMCSGHRSRDCG